MLRPATREAYELLHQGSLALAQIERAGIRIDVPYLERTTKEVEASIGELETRLKDDSLYKHWQARFGSATKLGSHQQLGDVLTKDLGFELKELTATKKLKMDESIVQDIDHPFVRIWEEWGDLKKLHGTYLKGIKREIIDGYIHPSFGLHVARTYRSQCERPNVHNVPGRNPKIAKLARSMFIAPSGYRVAEFDFKQIEVGTAACYNKDKRLINYVFYPTKDMHKDMAAECFMLEREEVEKLVRYCAKNMFVFPQFYGSYYVDCAKNLWEAVRRLSLKTKSGVGLYEHLASQGITRLGTCDPELRPVVGTFEYHIQQREKRFWERKFPEYAKWKVYWYREYLRIGGCNTFTGFKIEGIYKRNDIINYPIQGSAFHCLLWCLIKLQRWLVKKKLLTRIVGQIHDSIWMYIHPDEFDYVVAKVKKIITEDLPAHWDWIIVPMVIELEASPIDGNWYQKQEVKI